MTRAPSVDALATAAEWLNSYDDDGSDNRAHCREVAEWLLEQASAQAARNVETAAIRQIAAERGISPTQVRIALAHKRHAERQAMMARRAVAYNEAQAAKIARRAKKEPSQ